MSERTVELDFGSVTVQDQILIAKLNEGVTFDVANNKKLLDLGQEVFNNTNYGYISHRVNSYAVDPLVYFESAKVENLKAIAVVSDSEITRRNAEQVERKFYKDKNCFAVFENLDEAIEWMKTKL
ncbi:hypothetical protein E0K83_08510 [Gramella sp. BOM4]|nr:hypothetical protein [Christiangramia bathymodioli]